MNGILVMCRVVRERSTGPEVVTVDLARGRQHLQVIVLGRKSAVRFAVVDLAGCRPR